MAKLLWTRKKKLKNEKKLTENWTRRASGKWWLYEEYKTLDGVLKTIKKDENGCFRG